MRVIIDGQAWLYAQFFKLQAELLGKEVSEEEFEKWENEWKESTAELIEELLESSSPQS